MILPNRVPLLHKQFTKAFGAEVAKGRFEGKSPLMRNETCDGCEGMPKVGEKGGELVSGKA